MSLLKIHLYRFHGSFNFPYKKIFFQNNTDKLIYSVGVIVLQYLNWNFPHYPQFLCLIMCFFRDGNTVLTEAESIKLIKIVDVLNWKNVDKIGA